jgi:hypothetical protein
MLSKLVRLTTFSNSIFKQSSLNSTRYFTPSLALRLYSTTDQQQPPKADATPPPSTPKVEPAKAEAPKVDGKQVGKGKGPITWQSLSVAALFGAGLLVSNS